MKDDVILKVENLSKQYRLGLVGTGTISHDFNRFLARIRGKEDPYLKIGESNDRSTKGTSEYVWALKDINFEVKRGEILGIIGKNGAGKSTLLKILSKVTGPTTGAIKSKGRIASLLEVGTGFHPEMTGKENIFLNGAILGMTKKEITTKLDEIIEFSGCERYVETPVKRYSSGMKVRLAFAVAAFLEPDILVVDEVLAVGDAEFQKKAIGKMQDISSEGGRTVLFVSHNMAAVKSLCTTSVVLKDGAISFSGTVDKAVDYYLKISQKLSKMNLLERTDRDGNGKVKVAEVQLANSQDNPIEAITIGELLKIKIKLKLFSSLDLSKFMIAINFLNDNENYVLSYISDEMNVDFSNFEFSNEICLTIPELNLRASSYSIRVLLAEGNDRVDRIENVAKIEVLNKDIWNSGSLSREGNEPFINANFSIC
jgi:lipopolysaccharide transport system ATP-binding protein